MSLWLLGGLDPTGGAGILRDWWTASRVRPGVPTACVVSAFTRQGRGEPARSMPVRAEHFAASLARLPRPSAIKIGLVPDALIGVLGQELERHQVPVVHDPVLSATDGGHLGSSAAALAELASHVSLLTPNAEEAAALAGVDPAADDLADRVRVRTRAGAVLVKNVNGAGAGCVRDRLEHDGPAREFDRAMVPGPDPRGTGCALATAIACGLREGQALDSAVQAAISWLDHARTQIRPGPDGRPHLA